MRNGDVRRILNWLNHPPQQDALSREMATLSVDYLAECLNTIGAQRRRIDHQRRQLKNLHRAHDTLWKVVRIQAGEKML